MIPLPAFPSPDIPAGGKRPSRPGALRAPRREKRLARDALNSITAATRTPCIFPRRTAPARTASFPAFTGRTGVRGTRPAKETLE